MRCEEMNKNFPRLTPVSCTTRVYPFFQLRISLEKIRSRKIFVKSTKHIAHFWKIIFSFCNFGVLQSMNLNISLAFLFSGLFQMAFLTLFSAFSFQLLLFLHLLRMDDLQGSSQNLSPLVAFAFALPVQPYQCLLICDLNC